MVLGFLVDSFDKSLGVHEGGLTSAPAFWGGVMAIAVNYGCEIVSTIDRK